MLGSDAGAGWLDFMKAEAIGPVVDDTLSVRLRRAAWRGRCADHERPDGHRTRRPLD